MNTVATPGVYHHCRALLQRRVELASASGPCAQQRIAPLVCSSCASGYHRRALSRLPEHFHPRSGSTLRCGRTFKSLVCSATATESERRQTTGSLTTLTLDYQLTLTICCFTQVLHLQELPCPKILMQLVLSHGCMTGTSWPISARALPWMLLHLALQPLPHICFETFGAWHSGGNRMASFNQMNLPLAGPFPCPCHRQTSQADCIWAMQCLSLCKTS